MNRWDVVIIWIVGLLQLSVAGYAMRLNRLFGTGRVGWSLFSAFALLALLHLVQAAKLFGPDDEFAVKVQVGYALISFLLLIGMAHIETVLKERQRAEREAQKMEAIGQLTEGVAHDFNNILAVLRGYTSLLMTQQNNPETAGYLDEMSSTLDRAVALVRQLLTFGKRRLINTATLNLNEIVEDLTKMLRHLIKQNIVLQNVCAPDLPPILGDAAMLGQVVMNLVINGRDAMPQGGTLTLETSIVKVDRAHTVRHREARSGEFVCLRVSDSGGGISPAVLPHLFEPFSTTKAAGKGTGLGLVTVHEIVKEHSGWIEVRSKIGEGTEFRLYFPCAEIHPTLVEAAVEKPGSTAAS